MTFLVLLYLFRKIAKAHPDAIRPVSAFWSKLKLASGTIMAALLLSGATASAEVVTPTGLAPTAEKLAGSETIGRLTRYQVKPEARETLRHALSNYVAQALTEKHNLQAEAYQERDDASVLWLIERWQSRNELEHFQHAASFRAIAALKGTVLEQEPVTHYVKDLEPLAKQQWRRAPRLDDQPITIMLFVDSKAGTQDEFKTIYHAAMPALRGQPGVVTYQLSQIENESAKFVTFEKFRSDAAFAAHLEFPATKTIVDYLLTKSERQPFQQGLHTLIEFAPLTRDTGNQ